MLDVSTGRSFGVLPGPIQPESEVYFEYVVHTRLPLIPARIKPELFIIYPDCRVIDTCFSKYVNAGSH
jgi:hypothetical protein